MFAPTLRWGFLLSLVEPGHPKQPFGSVHLMPVGKLRQCAPSTCVPYVLRLSASTLRSPLRLSPLTLRSVFTGTCIILRSPFRRSTVTLRCS
jgi:hypothetical protein